MIPKILHQTFRTEEEIPAKLRPIMATWRAIHPDWSFLFWSDQQAEDLIRIDYPWLWETYKGLKFAIQRSDLLRIVVLHRLGGWYADLDYELLAPLDAYAGREYVLCELHPGTVGNAIMASKPGFWYWEAFLHSIRMALLDSKRKRHKRFHHILYTTGPGRHTELLSLLDLQIEPWEKFAPVKDNELHLLKPGPMGDAVAKHWWNAGWIEENDVYTPRPHLEQYEIHHQSPPERP